MVSLLHFNLIFSDANATFYHSNLCLFLVVNNIKCKYENDSTLTLRWSFLWNNNPFTGIMCRRPSFNWKVQNFWIFLDFPKLHWDMTKHFFCLFNIHQEKHLGRQLPKTLFDKYFHISSFYVRRCSTKYVFLKDFEIFTGKHLCWILF